MLSFSCSLRTTASYLYSYSSLNPSRPSYISIIPFLSVFLIFLFITTPPKLFLISSRRRNTSFIEPKLLWNHLLSALSIHSSRSLSNQILKKSKHIVLLFIVEMHRIEENGREDCSWKGDVVCAQEVKNCAVKLSPGRGFWRKTLFSVLGCIRFVFCFKFFVLDGEHCGTSDCWNNYKYFYHFILALKTMEIHKDILISFCFVVFIFCFDGWRNVDRLRRTCLIFLIWSLLSLPIAVGVGVLYVILYRRGTALFIGPNDLKTPLLDKGMIDLSCHRITIDKQRSLRVICQFVRFH